MKRLIIVLTLLAVWTGNALAEVLPDARAVCDVGGLSRYSGFVLDASTGEWSVCANEMAALLSYLPAATGQLNEYGMFFFALGGNFRTGVLWTELNVLYRHPSRQIGALSASFWIDETRYDVALQPRDGGQYGTEAYAALLGPEGIALLKALAAAETVEMQIIGAHAYRCAFAPQEKESARNSVINYTLRGLDGAVEIADGLDAGRCGLWADGVCALEREDVSAEDESLAEYLGKADRLCVQDKGKNVAVYQKLLRAAGYYPGQLDGAFGTAVQLATLRAQRYAGLLPTGCADRRTLEFLLGRAGAAEPEQPVPAQVRGVPAAGEAQPGVPYRLEEPACTIRIDRFWRADSLSASAAVDALATRTCADRDHRMRIAEGWIENEGMVELYLPDVLRAAFTCGDGAWTAVALVERNGGTELGSVLAARDGARLLLCAEVPKRLIQTPEALSVQALRYELERD